jgi:hypothetical protein
VVGGHPQVMVSAVSSDFEATLVAARAAGQASLRAVLADLARAEPAAVRWIPEAQLAAVDPTLASFLDIDTAAAVTRLEGTPKPPS